jgi:hypothetical protein
VSGIDLVEARKLANQHLPAVQHVVREMADELHALRAIHGGQDTGEVWFDTPPGLLGWKSSVEVDLERTEFHRRFVYTVRDKDGWRNPTMAEMRWIAAKDRQRLEPPSWAG